MTGADLVSSVMRLIGAIAPGETPTASESSDLIAIANGMLDAWNAQKLYIFTSNRNVYTLTAGKQAYTYGVGGDFDAPRPAKIDRISIISLNNPGQPLELPIDYLTDAQWQAVPVKNVLSALPLEVWDDGGFPLRTLSYWPIPNVQVQTAIYPWVALRTFPDVKTDVTFPPGYLEAIKYNLAARAAPEFNLPLSPVVAQLALNSMAVVKSINIPIVDLRCDPAVVNPKAQIYDWRSDTYVSR